MRPENIATAIEKSWKKLSTNTTAKKAAQSECAYLPSQISRNAAVMKEEKAAPRIL
jgi:hypothetical protein